jgi:hypothetical protein
LARARSETVDPNRHQRDDLTIVGSDDACEFLCNGLRRLAGGVDHRQSETSVMSGIGEHIVEVGRVTIGREPSPPFRVGAIEQYPGIDGPSDEFIRGAHAEYDERGRKNRVNDGVHEALITGPSACIAPHIAASKVARGRHQRIPVDDHMSRQKRPKEWRDRALSRTGRTEHVRQHAAMMSAMRRASAA